MSKKSALLFGLLALLALGLGACAPRTPNWHGLTATDEVAYLAAGPYVYAVRVSDGAQLWRYPADKADGKLQYYAAPVLTPDGQLLIGSEGATYALVSLDAQTGVQKWAAPFTGAKDKWIGSPLATADAIYAPNSDYSLYMLDLNGQQQRVFTAGAALWGQPVTDGKLIYVTSLDHRLYALDPKSALQDGKWTAEWSVDLGAAIPGSIAFGPDGLLYVGTFNSEVAAVDPVTRSAVRSYKGEGLVWSPPAFDGENLYFGDVTGKIYGYNIAGDSLWPVLQPDAAVISTPLVLDGKMVFTSESGSVFAIRSDGQSAWNVTLEGKLYGPAVAAGKYVLVAPLNVDTLIVALDANGLKSWSFTPAK